MTTAAYDSIAQTRSALAGSLQALCAASRDAWLQIPFASLVANGRAAWSDGLTTAANAGLWIINPQVAVNCETAQVVYRHQPTSPAGDHLLLPLAVSPERLDGSRVLEQLREDAQRPTDSAIDATEADRARIAAIAQHRIAPIWRWETTTQDPTTHAFCTQVVSMAADWEGNLADLINTARASLR